MTQTIKLLDSAFVEASNISLSLDLSPEQINIPAVHQVVKSLLANRRQGTASTKTRSEVRGGGKKPFKQKGTGRARQGSTRSPLMVGGGRPFGPKPRDYSQKINKKLMLTAIQSILADKFQSGKLLVIDSFKSDGKTKRIYQMLKERNLLNVLIVATPENKTLQRSVRNIPNAYCVPSDGFSVYLALKYENLIMEKEAFNYLVKRVEEK